MDDASVLRSGIISLVNRWLAASTPVTELTDEIERFVLDLYGPPF